MVSRRPSSARGVRYREQPVNGANHDCSNGGIQPHCDSDARAGGSIRRRAFARGTGTRCVSAIESRNDQALEWPPRLTVRGRSPTFLESLKSSASHRIA